MNAIKEQGGTVGKAMEVLELVAMRDRPVRFAEVLADSRYPKTTLYRMLQNLTRLGLLGYDDENQTYRPGLRLLSLAHSAWRQATLAPVARPVIDRLSSELGEAIHLAQLEKAQVLYVDKRNHKMPVDMFSQTGKIGPAYCTGVGKAMLAFLPPEQLDDAIRQQSFFRYTPNTLTTAKALRSELQNIRECGVAYDREEHEPGIVCVAAPIVSNQRLIGGLSITSTLSRRPLESLQAYEAPLVASAREIGELATDLHFPSTI